MPEVELDIADTADRRDRSQTQDERLRKLFVAVRSTISYHDAANAWQLAPGKRHTACHMRGGTRTFTRL